MSDQHKYQTLAIRLETLDIRCYRIGRTKTTGLKTSVSDPHPFYADPVPT
jgi:hypothetical protein